MMPRVIVLSVDGGQSATHTEEQYKNPTHGVITGHAELILNLNLQTFLTFSNLNGSYKILRM